MNDFDAGFSPFSTPDPANLPTFDPPFTPPPESLVTSPPSFDPPVDTPTYEPPPAYESPNVEPPTFGYSDDIPATTFESSTGPTFDAFLEEPPSFGDQTHVPSPTFDYSPATTANGPNDGSTATFDFLTPPTFDDSLTGKPGSGESNDNLTDQRGEWSPSGDDYRSDAQGDTSSVADSTGDQVIELGPTTVVDPEATSNATVYFAMDGQTASVATQTPHSWVDAEGWTHTGDLDNDVITKVEHKDGVYIEHTRYASENYEFDHPTFLFTDPVEVTPNTAEQQKQHEETKPNEHGNSERQTEAATPQGGTPPPQAPSAPPEGQTPRENTPTLDTQKPQQASPQQPPPAAPPTTQGDLNTHGQDPRQQPDTPTPPEKPGRGEDFLPYTPGDQSRFLQGLDSIFNPSPVDHPVAASVMDNLADRGKAMVDGSFKDVQRNNEYLIAVAEGRFGDALSDGLAMTGDSVKHFFTGFGHAVRSTGDALGDLAYYGTHSDEAGAGAKLGHAAVDALLDGANIVGTVDGAAIAAGGAAAAMKGASKRPGVSLGGEGGATKASAPPLSTTTLNPETVGPPPGTYKGKKGVNPGIKRSGNLRGQPSTEAGGTTSRTGTNYREYNGAELSQELRIDYDPIAGRPREVTYRVDQGTKLRDGEASDRHFTPDETLEGAQSTNSAYKNSGYDRGHLAQREAFKENTFPAQDALPTVNKVGDIPTPQEASDHFSNIIPMKVELNRGAGSPWAAAERETLNLADRYGNVRVRVEPIYDAQPIRLSDGTPVPSEIRRTVYGPDGEVLVDYKFSNR